MRKNGRGKIDATDGLATREIDKADASGQTQGMPPENLPVLTSKKTWVFLWVVFFSIAAAVLLSDDFRSAFLFRGTFWALTSLLFVFGFSLRKAGLSWEAWKERLRDSKWVLAALGLLWIGVAVQGDYQFKVLSDETNFVAVSRTMAESQNLTFPYEGRFYFGSYHPLNMTFDKRPSLYPFLTSFVNLAIGFHWWNGFLANLILGFFGSVMLYFLLKRASGVSGVASLLPLSFAFYQPLFFQSHTSSGVEPAFCVAVWVAIYLLSRAIQDGVPFFAPFFVSVAFVVHARQEGVVLGALFLLYFLFMKREALKWVFETNLTPLLGILVLPVLALRMSVADDFQGLTKEPFNLGALHQSWNSWLSIMRNSADFFPYNRIVLVLSVAVAILTLARGLKKGLFRLPKVSQIEILLLITAVVPLAIYSSYFWGRASDPAAARLYVLPLQSLAMLLAILAAPYLVRFWAPASVALAVLGTAVSLQASVPKDFTNSHHWRRLHREVKAALATATGDPRSVLFVTNVPNQFSIYDYSTTASEIWNQQTEGHLSGLRQGLYSEIWSMREIPLSAREVPTSPLVLPAGYRWKPFRFVQYNEIMGFLFEKVERSTSLLDTPAPEPISK